MELEQPSGDSAATEEVATVDTAATDATPAIELDEYGQPKEAAPVDDEAEDEVDGVKLRGKKEALEKLKAERLMQADYTRKTQEAAEIRKSAEAEKAQYQQAAQVQQHLGEEIAQIRAVDQRMAYLNQQIPTLVDTDPVQALRLHTELTQLQAHKGQLVNSATQKDQALRAFNESESSKRANAAEAVVMRELKDWSPEKYRELQDFSKAEGIDPEGLRQMLINVPMSAKIIEMARKFSALQKRQTAKPAVAPAPPASRLTGAAAVSTKEPAQMSDREFAEWRKRQIAQRK